MLTPSFAFLGQTLMNKVSALSFEINSDVLAEKMDAINSIILCAYDPNDITEHVGRSDFGYVPYNEELEFTIRFQNTGNTSATDVRIKTHRSDLLLRNSLILAARSHPVALLIDEFNKVIFNFENMLLPDSSSDELNSHGFVRYRININPNSVLGQEILSAATLYFDFNPPVVTNTGLTTISNCSDLENHSVEELILCAGEKLLFSSNASWVEQISWSYDNLSNIATELIPEQSGSIALVVSNALCEYSNSHHVLVNSPLADFTQSGNLLTASMASYFQWYMNNVQIDGATNHVYKINETANYSVEITDQFGFKNRRESELIIYNSTLEVDSTRITIFTNPANERLHILCSSDMIGERVIGTNICGQHAVENIKVVTLNPILDVSNLSSRMYIIRIGDRTSSLMKK